MLEEEVVVEIPDLPQVDEPVSGGQQVRRGLALGHKHSELKLDYFIYTFQIWEILFFLHAWLWKADGALTMSSLKRAPPAAG